MSKVSMGRSHPRRFSDGKTLRRCRNNEEADDFVLIDVDPENVDENVIVVDIPESLPKKWLSPKKEKKKSFGNVIYIDDDETPRSNRSNGVKNGGFTAGASSSRNFADDADEECQFVQENTTPVRLSKCRRTYSGKAFPRNRYGLESDPESDSSDDDDSPDCVLMDDSSGKVQEQWEKAFSRRRKNISDRFSGFGDHNRTTSQVNKEGQFCSGKRKLKKEDDTTHPFRKESDLGYASILLDPTVDDFSLDSLVKMHMRYTYGHNGSSSGVGCDRETSHAEEQSTKEFDNPKTDVKKDEVPIAQPSPQQSDVKKDDTVSKSQREEEDKDNELPSSPVSENSIINEREKLKETDEYKRAIEEEMAARKQALLIQAEEAQNLRRLLKRKKAESMRLLDMEKRQKQRVEEIRNTQKKDEENMNMKEVIRSEVRKELTKLEITCYNMASLLHSLGINMGSWPNPLPQEVQAAYKRALLTFHPDRASRTDIRQQVEAEEKFKLIHRLKQKFPLPS